jgi:hypothetical protein
MPCRHGGWHLRHRPCRPSGLPRRRGEGGCGPIHLRVSCRHGATEAEPQGRITVLHRAFRTARGVAEAAQPVTGNVIKRLAPGAPGTRRLQDRYCDALVCVRYRETADGRARFTSVELVVKPRSPAVAEDPGAYRIRRNRPAQPSQGIRRPPGCQPQTMAPPAPHHPGSQAEEPSHQTCPVMAIRTYPLMDTTLHLWQQMAIGGCKRTPHTSR